MQGLLAVQSKAVSDFKSSLDTAGNASGLATTNSTAVIVGNIINTVLGLSGIVLVGLLVYAGILYMQGGSDEQKVKQAKEIIKNAIIGIVIVVMAYAIASFVIGQLSGVLSV